MRQALFGQLSQALRMIDRPGSYCVSGSVSPVLPGLEVPGLGPIGLPLTAQQAEQLKQKCALAPYGKGEETLVDPTVRRVWRMQPGQFALTNPDWEEFLRKIVHEVQEGLGLQKRKLESHLYDLLLYEPGSFFLPHRDGEKLDRMVATLVIVLPSAFQGGELVVRHEGQEQTIDFGGPSSAFRIHFAAFYADCEHEIRPLREGHRLCLVYNLTLAKGKKPIGAPRSSESVSTVSKLLAEWAKQDTARKLAITLGHQYTQEGLTCDALKGADSARARVLFEAARQAGCRAHLALLTLHEMGEAEYSGGYSRRRWGDEYDDSGPVEMGEVIESSLSADYWSDREGNRVPLGEIPVEEDEVLEPDALQAIEPEEEFEGYTGNAGMTLDRWYRHAAILVWPNRRHHAVLCDAGTQHAVQALQPLVKQWRLAGGKADDPLRAECIDFAGTILARWVANPYGGFGQQDQSAPLLHCLEALDDLGLFRTYLGEVMVKDVSVDPGKTLAKLCQQHGWGTFQPELLKVFGSTTTQTIERNVRLLEHLGSARAQQQAGWTELCAALAEVTVQALEGIDQPKKPDYTARTVNRTAVLSGLAHALLATEQFDLLSRVVAHTLARPEKYPLTLAHVAALTSLQPWLAENLTKPCPALAHWVASCCEQLEARTAQAPQAPADFRRAAALPCTCQDCRELSQFLENPQAKEHRFRVREDRRQHLEHQIRHAACDLDLRTERAGSPYTLVCTKNTASYQAKRKTFREDEEHLRALRSIQGRLPK